MADSFQLSTQSTSELLNSGKNKTAIALEELFNIETMQLIFLSDFFFFLFSQEQKHVKARKLLSGLENFFFFVVDCKMSTERNGKELSLALSYMCS